MSLRDYLRAIRKRWPVVLLVSLLGAAAGVLFVVRATPVYQGSVTFFATTPSVDVGSSLAGDQFGQQRVNSYVKLLGSERLADRILQQTDVDRTPLQLSRSIDGKADLNTVILTAYVRDSSLQDVGEITEALTTQFPAMIEEIESQNGTKDAPVKLDVVSGPTVDPDPVSPKKKLTVGVGLLLGLVVGVLLALLRALLDRTVRSTESLREVTNAPVLGRIPVDNATRKAPLVQDAGERWERAEAFRQLRTNLQFVDIDRPVTVLVVTSSIAGEGKSSTAANLASTFAATGRRVLLVDADLRRPTLADVFGLERNVGLTNVLVGQVALADVVQPWGPHYLDLLASGPVPPNPSELLGSQHMVELVEHARAQYDLVIIDTAPLLPVTDGAIAAARADGAVLVVRYGKTRVGEVERSLESLQAVDARVLGLVLNQTPVRGMDGHSYEGYAYRPPPERKDLQRKSARATVHTSRRRSRHTSKR